MKVPSFYLGVENDPAYAALTRGFGDVMLQVYQQEDGKMSINLDCTTAALIDALGCILAHMPVSDSEEGRNALLATVMADIGKAITFVQAQPAHMFTGTTVQ